MSSQRISKSDTPFESFHQAASFDTQFVVHFYETDEKLGKNRYALLNGP